MPSTFRFFLLLLFTKSLFALAVNVRDFGALGDGQTDDTLAIQKAIEHAHESLTKSFTVADGQDVAEPRIDFPKGVYVISKPILLHRWVWLSGNGEAEIRQTNPALDLLYAHEALRVRIEGLTFRGGRRQIKIWTRSVPGASVFIKNCSFLQSSDFAVDCISPVDSAGTPIIPYQIEFDASGLPRTKALGESAGHPGINPTLLRIEKSKFLACARAVNSMCEMGIVEDCEAQMPSTMRGGAFRSTGRFKLSRVRGAIKPLPGYRQHWLTLVSGVGILRKCTFTTREKWGVCGVYVISGGKQDATAVIIDNSIFQSAGCEENSLVYCLNLPNLVAVRNSQEMSQRTVKILGLAKNYTRKQLHDLRFYHQGFLEERLLLDIKGNNTNLSSEVPKDLRKLRCNPLSEGAAIMFEDPIPELTLDNFLPRRTEISAQDCGAKGDGVADDTDALQETFNQASAGQMVTIPNGVYRITSPVKINDDIVVKGIGTAAFSLETKGKPGFTVRHARKILFQNCLFFNGETAFEAATDATEESEILFSDCTFRDLRGPALVLAASGGEIQEPNRSQFRLANSCFLNCSQILRSNFHSGLVDSCYILSPKGRAKGPLFENQGNLLSMANVLGLPRYEPGSTQRWIDNYGDFAGRNIRFGPENGGMTLVVNKPNRRQPPTVKLENSDAWCLGNTEHKSMIYCKNAPKIVLLRNCIAAPQKQATLRYAPGLAPGHEDIFQAKGNVFPVKVKTEKAE